MKKVKKVILWFVLSCVVVFFAVWNGALLKNYILTVKYNDVLENMEFYEDQIVIEYDYERIISYSETEIKTYFVKDMGNYFLGGTVSYRRGTDGKWIFDDNVKWSGRGTAEDVIWPYWHHYIILVLLKPY